MSSWTDWSVSSILIFFPKRFTPSLNEIVDKCLPSATSFLSQHALFTFGLCWFSKIWMKRLLCGLRLLSSWTFCFRRSICFGWRQWRQLRFGAKSRVLNFFSNFELKYSHSDKLWQAEVNWGWNYIHLTLIWHRSQLQLFSANFYISHWS